MFTEHRNPNFRFGDPIRRTLVTIGTVLLMWGANALAIEEP